MAARGKAAKKRDVTRRARTREDADAGVNECVLLMTTGQWITGKSQLDVSAKHGVCVRRGKEWAATASRIIRLAIKDDLEDIRARMLVTLDTIVAGSVNVEPRTAIAAIDTQAKLLGLVVQKHEVAMTEAEADRLIAEAAKLAKVSA